MRTVPFLVVLVACFPGKGGDGDTGDVGGDTGVDVEDTDGDGDGDDGDDSDVEEGPATLRGRVTVALYQTGEDGEIEEVSWADATGGVWPFGALFVAAYVEDEETGEQTWLASQTFSQPSVDGEDFELVVEDVQDLEAPVALYAAVDYWGDRILGSGEPSAVRTGIALEPHDEVEGLDLAITSPYAFGSGGGVATPVVVSGDMEYDGDWAGGECVSLLYDSTDYGPYTWNWFTPGEDDAGAVTGTWAYSIWDSFGDAHLRGACDDNLNLLIDPADVWGTVVEDGHDDNPVPLGSDAVPDQHLVIPFAGARSSVVPAVDIGGDVYYGDGFETMPAGTVVYVVALRTPPSHEISVADFISAYDVVELSGDDLTGVRIDWTLEVPTWKTVYVWGYADTDGDGTVNEATEPLGNPGSNGRVTVTDDDVSGYGMNLQAFQEDTGQ